MIDIGQFAKPHIFSIEGRPHAYRFALTDRATMAAAIHAFADGVARGEIAITKVQAGQVATDGDWYHQAVFFEFDEAEPQPAERAPPERVIELLPK